MKYGDAKKTWAVVLDGQEHTFRLEHNFWSGERKYYVDDELIEHITGSLGASANFGQDVEFTVGGHECRFQYRSIGRTVFYDLYIDEQN